MHVIHKFVSSVVGKIASELESDFTMDTCIHKRKNQRADPVVVPENLLGEGSYEDWIAGLRVVQRLIIGAEGPFDGNSFNRL